MKNVKKSHKKALPRSVNIGTKNFIIPAIDMLVAIKPEFIPCWILVKGFYGALFDIKQEEINNFVSFIRENNEIFTREILKTKDFRDGFVITFEEYLKQRNENKRKIIQNIFLGFTKNNVKECFELERMYDLLNKISEYQMSLINKVKKEKQIIIKSNMRDVTKNNYEYLKYLEYLGILSCEKKGYVETDVSYEDEEADSNFYETEKFSLSVFGENFVKFILKR